MIIARTLIRRLLVAVILVSSFLKLAVARIIPTGSQSSETSGIKTGHVVRLVPSAADEDASGVHYVLETTEVFPYVRVVGLRHLSAPVPVEVAPVPEVVKRQPGHLTGTRARVTQKRLPAKRRVRPLTRRVQSDHDKKPYCYPANSQSCLACPICCIICCSCGGCSGCSCTSCTC